MKGSQLLGGVKGKGSALGGCQNLSGSVLCQEVCSGQTLINSHRAASRSLLSNTPGRELALKSLLLNLRSVLINKDRGASQLRGREGGRGASRSLLLSTHQQPPGGESALGGGREGGSVLCLGCATHSRRGSASSDCEKLHRQPAIVLKQSVPAKKVSFKKHVDQEPEEAETVYHERDDDVMSESSKLSGESETPKKMVWFKDPRRRRERGDHLSRR